MKIFKDGKYVKLVPSRYEPIEKIILNFCETKKKRLSVEERKQLELELLMHNLERNEKYVSELIKGREFKGVIKVARYEAPHEYRALFEDAPKVRISQEIALILNGGDFDEQEYEA